jgi:phosphoribosylamine-glycine ligase
VTSYGKNIETSLKVCYANVEKITFEKKQFRKDIGKDLITKK